jgi:hypothetical protein
MAERVNIFELPLTRRTCVDCESFEVREDEQQMCESWCAQWSEPLDDETIAVSCPEFTRVS